MFFFEYQLSTKKVTFDVDVDKWAWERENGGNAVMNGLSEPC